MQRFLERRACAVCAGLRHSVLRSLPFAAPAVWDFVARYYAGRIAAGELGDARYEIRKCADCGFLWQAYHLDEVGMQCLYEDWISPQESLAKKTRAGAALLDGYARELAAIARRLGRRPAALRVLDYGMGWGFWCRVAQAHGCDVAGCELSERRLAYARGLGIRVVEALEGEAPFDVINCHQTLEHLPEPCETLARLARALAPGGLVRLSVPDGSGAERALLDPRWRAGKDALQPLEHLNCFTRATLARIAARAGLAPAREPARPRARWRGLRARLAGALRRARPRAAAATLYLARAGA